MKNTLEKHLASAVDKLKADGLISTDHVVEISTTRTKDPSHGDFATNLALQLAKVAGRPPRELAMAIVAALPANRDITEVQVAGPGFINFFLAQASQASVVADVLTQGSHYGRAEPNSRESIQVEFVSANPTGPLHVGHGRGAALGATMANLLDAAGFQVQREYYVNDAGRQMHILATSTWLRYLELRGESLRFPDNGYVGDYVKLIAKELADRVGDDFRHATDVVFEGVRADAEQGGDKEQHIDDLAAKAQSLLGPRDYQTVFDLALNNVLDDIRGDLAEFGVTYDRWFSEHTLSSELPAVVEALRENGHLYENDGALWFRSSDFGDDKDRVVQRANGQFTYFTSDIAYMNNKLERFEHVLYIFGADHHGYVSRLKAAAQALGQDPERLEFLLIQFAVLYRGGEKVQMSTRSGQFVTIRELRDDVGRDAARWFYVMRKYQQHLDFDLDLATSESNDNPVYYVQYAHARICSVARQLEQRGLPYEQQAGLAALEKLVEPEEHALLVSLASWPEVIMRAAEQREPHQITSYLRDLANALHTYYNAHKVLVEDEAVRQARLALLFAVRQVLANGLTLLDVSTPEVM